jgi:hypothetical protein
MYQNLPFPRYTWDDFSIFFGVAYFIILWVKYFEVLKIYNLEQTNIHLETESLPLVLAELNFQILSPNSRPNNFIRSQNYSLTN